MNIEITGEAEQVIQAALASGKYASVEEFILAMSQPNGRNSTEKFNGLPQHIDVDALADIQGIGPIEDFRSLKADFWPEDETVDDFLSAIRMERDKDIVRKR